MLRAVRRPRVARPWRRGTSSTVGFDQLSRSCRSGPASRSPSATAAATALGRDPAARLRRPGCSSASSRCAMRTTRSNRPAGLLIAESDGARARRAAIAGTRWCDPLPRPPAFLQPVLDAVDRRAVVDAAVQTRREVVGDRRETAAARRVRSGGTEPSSAPPAVRTAAASADTARSGCGPGFAGGRRRSAPARSARRCRRGGE